MAKAVIIGGSGQIGQGIAARLIAEGCHVTCLSRTAPKFVSHRLIDGVTWKAFDRAKNDLGLAIDGTCDLLIDCIAFDAQDAEQLLGLANRVGHVCAISSASVYRDAEGRTLDEARQNGFPSMPVPIPVTQPTVAAGPETYSTRKIAMESVLLANDQVPVTILRPCAIYGPGSVHAREWYFVKRLLDRRKQIALAYQGRSQFHTTSTLAIGDAVLAALQGKMPRIANVADARAVSVSEIAKTIMAVMGIGAELVGLSDMAYPPVSGVTPWSIPLPFIVGTEATLAPLPHYEDRAAAAVRDLIARTEGRAWQDILPALAAYPWNLFDYAAEDAAIAAASARD